MAIARFKYTTGLDIVALPISALIADWAATSKPAASEGVGSDAGLYAISLDASVSLWWFLFDAGTTPTDWTQNIGVVNLGDLVATDSLLVAFSYDTGLRIFAHPRDVSIDDYATARIEANEVDTGLYTLEVTADHPVWDVFVGTGAQQWSGNIAEVFLGATQTSSGATGDVVNLLSVDYEDDYLYLDGIEDVGFEFGPQRTTALNNIGSGVKAKRSAITHNEVMIAAATIGFEPTDCVFVVWAKTLFAGTVAVEPLPDDKIVAFDATWVIRSVKRNVDFAQWRCIVRRSALA